MKKRYTLSIFTENVVGILNRVNGIFTRRKINIESIAASESEIKDVYRYTMVVEVTEEEIRKIALQIEKQIEVITATYYLDSDIVYQEIALYKMSNDVLLAGGNVEKIIRLHQARILSVEKEFTVIEKTGHQEETHQLFKELKPYGILEFVRSGRVAIAKPMQTLSSIVNELENLTEEAN
ncbi:acetolactate synthase, small subunit [Bernardetia litoralis DSM 6794]|uniref:Acetolactate synthase small subunit n=1 Tax=Bernardetia litoralis (strain ATCC 23117 / DSM 6794 / NBRC 15988 / NCIMB 1366 / Fx l1 / Sio-4) TaxID=880071 RepID=I4AIR4_BERLS|nr:acetolactate synthase small subunit [Bernardetia litoralis]AFM03849.1 acetolactate synthase, small subunit [Bernardetia litoralis DSM 6794]